MQSTYMRYEAYEWNQPEGGNEADPVEKDYQEAKTINARKLRVVHNKAFKWIRQNLSDTAFDKTKGCEMSVPKLLRFVHKYWFDGLMSDRDRLRMEFEGLKLTDYDNMDVI